MLRTLPKTAAVAAALVGTFATMAAQAAEYATVLSSTPVLASVPQARQVCSQGEQYVRQQPSGAGAVIGAIAGGLLGHTVGGGFGRAAATGVGVVAGAAVGNQVEANGNPGGTVPVQRCQNVTSYENRVIGYDVVYEYAGQRYNTRTARDPGQQMAVSVQPSEAANVLPVNSGQAVYGSSQPVPTTLYQAAPAYAPAQTVYYEPSAYYSPSPAYYVAPAIGLGLGLGLAYYGGYRHGGYGYRRWH